MGLDEETFYGKTEIIGILRQVEADGVIIRDLCRKHNITEQTFFRWRNTYNGMTVPEAHRLKDLEAENAKLKKLLAEQLLAIEGVNEIAGKKW
jgi:putative transposase